MDYITTHYTNEFTIISHSYTQTSSARTGTPIMEEFLTFPDCSFKPIENIYQGSRMSLAQSVTPQPKQRAKKEHNRQNRTILSTRNTNQLSLRFLDSVARLRTLHLGLLADFFTSTDQ